MLTVAKTAFAGVMLEIFSARSMASMAAFNKEMALSRPFGRWELVAMVETQGSREKTVREAAVRKNQNPNRDGRPSCHRLPCVVTRSKCTEEMVHRSPTHWTSIRRSLLYFPLGSLCRRRISETPTRHSSTSSSHHRVPSSTRDPAPPHTLWSAESLPPDLQLANVSHRRDQRHSPQSSELRPSSPPLSVAHTSQLFLRGSAGHSSPLTHLVESEVKLRVERGTQSPSSDDTMIHDIWEAGVGYLGDGGWDG